jgi:hypothetical protein
MVLPVGLVSLADQDRDVHPFHVHLKLLFTYGTMCLPLLIVYGLPVGLVCFADKDRDVHPPHVHPKLPLTYGTRRLPLLSLWFYL